ncbi:MAG: hypothetical protein COW30_08440 [Rhodospirillales bacterium CG15_BIG_FIL_POST_REV_8_21_14_020_66_15]|nr:MAG: hypothetical protein COW30_08440 [Rhodospirillales bacterium CG15_BIG_FIL_POST_REV_8_21_14_020_66_15]
MMNSPGDHHEIYLDNRIQGVMLIALVVMEATLTLGGIGVLYNRYTTIIDANLYRIHADTNGPTLLELMLTSLGEVLLVILVVNIAALVVADRIWVFFVRRVLKDFREQLQRMSRLDFRIRQNSEGRHRILDSVLEWTITENERHKLLRDEMEALSKAFEQDGPTPKNILHTIGRLRRQIPGNLPSADEAAP